MSVVDNIFVKWRRSGMRGFTRAQSVWHAVGGRTELIAKTRYGSRFSLDPLSVIDDAVLREGYYESEVFDAILKHLTPNAVFWDIGSNFGLHSITVKFTRPDTRVFAFEPNSVMAARIQQQAAINHLDINVVCAALSNSDDPQLLHIPGKGNPGMATLSPWDQAKYERTCIVPCFRAETLMRRKLCSFPNVVKLDVEGFEPQVLEGFGRTLENTELRAVIFEGASDTSGPAMTLKAAGFKISKLNRNEETAHSLHNFVAER
jgi:FkbM family methyltransferase